jgi:hypothetical protein
MILFSELCESEAVDSNPVRDIYQHYNQKAARSYCLLKNKAIVALFYKHT